MRAAQASLGHDAHRIVKFLYLTSDFHKLCNCCLQMFRNHIQNRYISFGSCRCKHESSSLDLIRNNRILCTMQMRNSADLDHIRSCSPDICSHTVEEVGNIYNMRFFRNIFKNGKPLCHGCRHHNINGSAHTDNIKINVFSYQPCCLGDNLAVFNVHIRTKRAESFQMLVNGTASNVASSRKRHLCSFIFPKKSSQQIIRCSYLLNIVIFNIKTGYAPPVNLYGVAVHTVHRRSDPGNSIQQYINVIDIRKIVNHNCFITHNCSRKNSKGCIFCSAYLHFTDKRIAAFNNILFHTAPRSHSHSLPSFDRS